MSLFKMFAWFVIASPTAVSVAAVACSKTCASEARSVRKFTASCSSRGFPTRITWKPPAWRGPLIQLAPSRLRKDSFAELNLTASFLWTGSPKCEILFPDIPIPPCMSQPNSGSFVSAYPFVAAWWFCSGALKYEILWPSMFKSLAIVDAGLLRLKKLFSIQCFGTKLWFQSRSKMFWNRWLIKQ